MTDLAAAYGEEMRELTERLIAFETTDGDEAPAQALLGDRLSDLGFATYEWEADAEELAAHPTFPPAAELDVEGRPSVAGVLELGDPDAGRTLVLNGHVDVVPATPEGWTGDPFSPRWEGDRLVARGAVDMKSQLAACVYAARHLADTADIDGRIVVESVAGEEEGGIGATAAALSNPYPFERDGAIVAEPTDMRAVTAVEGTLMARLRLTGRSAHAARRWRGEDVLPRFERVREALSAFEAERSREVTHPLYDRFDVPWPIVVGRVEAGTWASNVPDTLEAEARIGVSPDESIAEVEQAFRERLGEVASGDEWLTEHPPELDRFGIQFPSAETDPDAAVVGAVQGAMAAHDLDPGIYGETYGADACRYIEAGIPTVVFGPGRVEEAHFPDEYVHWPEVLQAGDVLVDAARRFLGS